MLSLDQTVRFERDGYLLVRDVLTPEQVANARKTVEELFASPSSYEGDTATVRFDVFSRNPSLRWILANPGINAAVADVLGKDFVYLPETAAHNAVYSRWHKDTTAQEQAGLRFQWEPDYKMIEIALYLQDNDVTYGGGLDVSPGGHRRPDWYSGVRQYVTRLQRKVLDGDVWFPRKMGWNPASIPSRAGDLVLFDFRIDHQATHPRVPVLDIPPHIRKYSIFAAASANTAHVGKYIDFISRRPEYKYLKDTKHRDEMRGFAKEHAIRLA